MLEEKDKYYAEILEKEVDFCHKWGWPIAA
jgi:hypothetical protein